MTARVYAFVVRNGHYGASGKRESILKAGMPADWLNGVIKREAQRWGRRSFTLEGFHVEVYFNRLQDEVKITLFDKSGQLPPPRWLGEAIAADKRFIEDLRQARRAEANEPPIDKELMVVACGDIIQRHLEGQSTGRGIRWEHGFKNFLVLVVLGLGGVPGVAGRAGGEAA